MQINVNTRMAGPRLVYLPACHRANILAELMGKMSFSQVEMALIQQMGIKVMLNAGAPTPPVILAEPSPGYATSHGVIGWVPLSDESYPLGIHARLPDFLSRIPRLTLSQLLSEDDGGAA
jgi:hypothetical protein